MEHNQVFENYDEAHAHSLTVPWKLETCNVGDSCWCRIIAPINPIKYKNTIGDTERIDEIDYIIPDGSIDKETAEYFLELHHDKLKHYMNKQENQIQSMLDAIRSAEVDTLELPEINNQNTSTVKPQKLPKNETWRK